MNTGYYVDYRSHNELLQLLRRVDGFESGEIYQKITAEYEKKLALKDREINRLTKRNDLLANKNRLLLSENKQLKTDIFMQKYVKKDCTCMISFRILVWQVLHEEKNVSV